MTKKSDSKLLSLATVPIPGQPPGILHFVDYHFFMSFNFGFSGIGYCYFGDGFNMTCTRLLSDDFSPALTKDVLISY